MQLFSSSSPNPKFPLLPTSSSNPNNQNPTKFHSFTKIPLKSTLQSLKIPPFSPSCCFSTSSSTSSSSFTSTTNLDEKLLMNDDDEEEEDGKDDVVEEERIERVLIVRRPVMELSEGEEEEEEEVKVKVKVKDVGSFKKENEVVGQSSTGIIDVGLNEFAKKMPIFEPERVEGSSDKMKPLGVNLELALYRAKVLSRNYEFEEAKEILQKCISVWPEDGRAYVALGKIFGKQSKSREARGVYERGCQATQGENSYIWQCWAVLETKMGNIRRARELFDAATVADKKHIAAWHGWAVLELKQGNLKKARNLLGKGLKYCGGNEYVYQTLALLEAKANRIEQARYLFKQATKCNHKSCASWLAWAQLEMQQENNHAARLLFEQAIQASPKNRFAWHIWGMFEANLGDIEQGRKLLTIGHALNPRDPVLLQSLALLEYKYATANLARVLFRRASEMDPRHQPVWIAWGWMEWKEGNINKARELYQRALSISSTTESAARCLQAWGVLEQRIGNMSAARRLFRSSLNINSQSYVTWMTWAALEEEQGNSVRAEEIRDLYFQQRTEVVDDASWVMGFLDIIDPTLDKIKRLLNIDQNSSQSQEDEDPSRNTARTSGNNSIGEDWAEFSSSLLDGSSKEGTTTSTRFNLDAFIKEKLALDTSRLDVLMETGRMEPSKMKNSKNVWRPERRSLKTLPQP